MRNGSFIIILIGYLLFSCKESSYLLEEENIKQSIGADQLTIKESKDTIVLKKSNRAVATQMFFI